MQNEFFLFHTYQKFKSENVKIQVKCENSKFIFQIIILIYFHVFYLKILINMKKKTFLVHGNFQQKSLSFTKIMK